MLAQKTTAQGRMEVEDLVKFVRSEFSTKPVVDAETCLRVGAALAVKVNALSNLNGSEKKKLVVDVVLRCLKEAEEKEKAGKADTTAIVARYDRLEKSVSETLPVSLELIVSASRGKLDLKKVKPSVLLRYCSCFAKTVVTVLVSQKVISEEVAKKVEEKIEIVEEKAEVADSVVDAVQKTVESPASAVTQLQEVVATVVENPVAEKVESSTEESKA